MNMIKIVHKPSGRALIIDEKHAASFLNRKEKDYIEVPIEKEAPKEEPKVEKEPAQVSSISKKTTKKKVSKKKIASKKVSNTPVTVESVD